MSFHYYGRAEEAAKRILDLFQAGDVPAALAPIFIRRHENTPCRSWSNQILTALAGHDDARGFRQWEEVGRHVRKGEHGFPILVPIHAKREVEDKATGQTEERLILVGFKACIVFGYSQTEGAELPGNAWARQFIDALPLVDVAKRWGLTVQTYNGSTRAPLGKYRFGESRSIALGTENLSTWAHELMHAADDRLGNMTEKGQHWRSETVAEMGGAILLTCMGLEKDADAGGCWDYVRSYARDAGLDPMIACQRVLKRTCDAVALVLAEYDALQQPAAAGVAA